MINVSVKTVSRKIAKLKQMGLVKFEYMRPPKHGNGNQYAKVHILRVIYGDKAMTPGDITSIRQPDQPDKALSGKLTGHIDVLQTSQDNHAVNKQDKALSTDMQDNSVSGKRSNDIKTMDTRAELEYTTADILKCWQQFAKGTPNEADQFIAQALHDQRVPFADIKGAICDHCLEAHEAGRPYAVRLKPAVAELLAAR
jgi:hypothetical protein